MRKNNMRNRLALSLFAACALLGINVSAQTQTYLGTRRVVTSPSPVGTSLPRTYTHGTSCAGTPAGSAVISEDPNTTADVGDLYTLRLSGAPANTPVVLNLDTNALVWNGIALPFNLAPLGAPNCMAYVGPTITYSTNTDANGNASLSVNIPNNPALDGLRVHAQWMIVQLGRNPLGVTSTDAISFTIRNPIILRSVIGSSPAKTNNLAQVEMDNTLPGGFSFSTIPVPVQSPVEARLKTMRIVGGYNAGASPAPGSGDFSVWSSFAAIPGNYMTGDVYNTFVSAPVSSTPFGTSVYSTPNNDYRYNLLSNLSGLTLQANQQYYLGFSPDTGGYASFGVSDTLSPSCPADTLFGNQHTGGVLIQGVGIQSGCVAVEYIATSVD